jgi:hypothetical protein
VFKAARRGAPRASDCVVTTSAPAYCGVCIAGNRLCSWMVFCSAAPGWKAVAGQKQAITFYSIEPGFPSIWPGPIANSAAVKLLPDALSSALPRFAANGARVQHFDAGGGARRSIFSAPACGMGASPWAQVRVDPGRSSSASRMTPDRWARRAPTRNQPLGACMLQTEGSGGLHKWHQAPHFAGFAPRD